MARDDFVICGCCNQSVAKSTERRHRKGQAKPHVRASYAYQKSILNDPVGVDEARRSDVAASLSWKRKGAAEGSSNTQARRVSQAQVPSGSSQPQHPNTPVDSENAAIVDMNIDEVADSEHEPTAGLDQDTAAAIQRDVWGEGDQHSRRSVQIEDLGSDDEDEPASGEDERENAEDSASYDEEWWNDYIDEIMESGLGEEASNESASLSGLSAVDQLGEDFERSYNTTYAALSETDKATLRTFALKTDEHLTRRTLEKLPFAFPGAHVPSANHLRTRVAFLSGIKPVLYDCCPNSCCCYTGPHAALDNCPYCKAPRRDSRGKARSQFSYIPLIPRLQAFQANTEMATAMKHRAHGHTHKADSTISDVYDSTAYRSKLRQRVRVHDKELRHCHFSDPRDVALGLATDGFGPFRRRNKTAWPLVGFNYNLPPETRFTKKNWIPFGVVPGPKKPVDFDSFLWPLVTEMLELAVGVRAFDALSQVRFLLHAYMILASGDIPALSMLLHVKGHNGKCPCRMCEIVGVRIPNKPRSPYYVPLDRSRHPDVAGANAPPRQYSPFELPKRTHDRFMAQGRDVQMAPTAAESERLAKECGIKGVPLLSCLSSLTFPDSFPYDFMHLVWENVIKNLVALWTGQYRELDSGREDYELSPETWKIIGEATAASGSTIPSAYGPRPPNIDTDKQACTADSWSFWTLYIAPVVLRGRFRHEKYYKHFIKLVKILHVCLQFEMTRSEVADVRRGLAEWVEEYEKIYYQNTPSRLAACPLTIHALLHVADSIEAAGPVWASWAFPMERYCGMLKPAIRSRRFPYTTLAHYVLDTARLLQVKLVYDAADVLSLRRPMQDMSTTFPEYQMCALLPPSRKAVTLDKAVHDKIISHLSTRFEAPVRDVRAMLRPETITQWGKLQILGGGDLVRSTTLGGIREDSRNASYVRYESLVDKFAGQRNRPSVFELRTFYGELQHIVSLDVQVTDTAGARRVETLILAGIRTCKLDDRPSPGGLDIHYYTTTGRYEVVDINNIQCLVGRIHDRGQWAIVDRSGSLARAIYVEEDIN